MTEDARFEDGGEQPLNLGALDVDDLQILSSLVQDAVLPMTEMRWDRSAASFAVLLNRFRWEDQGGAARGNRPPERVQSVLMVRNVQAVSSQGVDRTDKDMILSVLSVTFEETDAPSGHIELTFAGDGAIRLGVEALDVTLKDVTRPYVAPSKSIPTHGV